MPIWPDAFVGSLAHDATVAVAALARRSDYLGIGVDIEPAEPLAPDLLAMVATARERAALQGAATQGRLLFSIKEAVYKAVYPLDRAFLDHQDVEVDFAARQATVRNGRAVRFVYGHTSHVLVLAFIPAPDGAPIR
jgi:4'-phosphopantetheinyl transferase EntD